MSLAIPFRAFVDKHQGKTVQICLKGGGPMSGTITYDVAHEDFYRIVCEAQIGAGDPLSMPFHFDATDILWFSPGPIASDKPRIWGS